MRMNIYSSLAALKSGLDLMIREEGVKVDKMFGHGGLFKTKGVGQSVLAAAINSPVSVMETAGEGGPWGMALLASYLVHKNGRELGKWLEEDVFASAKKTTVEPEKADIDGFNAFFANYKAGLPVLKAAVENI